MLETETIAIGERAGTPDMRGGVTGVGGPLRADSEPDDDIGPVAAFKQYAAHTGLCEALEQTVRGPLAAIGYVAEVLKIQLDGARAEQVQFMAEAAGRTDRMLRDLLEYVRMQEGEGIPIARRRIDLRLLCGRLVDTLQRANPETAITFVSDVPVPSNCDPDRIALLLTRLVTNAIEHGAEPRTIRVVLRDVGGRAVIDVWNAKPPIGPDVLRRLFQPFVRGESARSRHVHNLGLGLYLSRDIARAHAGHLEALCDASGTTFRVTLRRCRE
jgi:signal transduction histidine kinase